MLYDLEFGLSATANDVHAALQLIWTADAYIRPETYQAALARIIDARHLLLIAAARRGQLQRA